MKINIFKSSFFLLLFAFLVACSTKKDTFMSRNSHALSTKYNILYNGGVGYDKGVKTIKSNNEDDFWQLLPIEKMLIKDEINTSKKSSNPDFELAETKATKAIQKHSMNIEGREKNSQIDEAYLMLGKARYYDQRFIPALDAFNYILYKYPNSSNIYEAKIWREKTNMRLGNDALVIKNISKLIEDYKMSHQVFADANALLTASFLNLEEKDSAIAKIKLAIDFTKINQEKARYRFILGQLYQQLGYKDSAVAMYQSVIKMNRRADRKFVIQAQAKKADLFDYNNGDFVAFQKTFDKLIKDRENRPYKDLIYYHYGLFFDKQNKQKEALHLYNASLRSNSKDTYLVASNYRNIGNMYFREALYTKAAKYYDSTLVKLDTKSREFLKIKKIRGDLNDVILYEAIAQRNDSILNVVALNPADKIAYYENYITQLKQKDNQKRLLEEKNQTIQDNIKRNNTTGVNDIVSQQNPSIGKTKSIMMPPSMPGNPNATVTSAFYFYNPTTVAFGKLEFKKIWGDRAAEGNWRISSVSTTNINTDSSEDGNTNLAEKPSEVAKIVPEYTAEFYLKKLPQKDSAIDSIQKERNFANYQLGIIYKEKFKENQLAIAKLEHLLNNNPEPKLVLPALYNLYKLYEITDSSKAVALKQKITAEYPESRYTQILNNNDLNVSHENLSPEGIYTKWYKLYEQQQYVLVLENIDQLITQFSGETIVSKFELLKANTIAKLRGVTAYKEALQFVADNYPNSEEGKNAQVIITEQIPLIDKMELVEQNSKSWKILFKVGLRDDANTKEIEDKIKIFNTEENYQQLRYSYDVYTEKENFITIHGITSKTYAEDILYVLREKPKFKIANPAIIISGENYKVIQIKKNLETYLALEKK